MSILTVLALAAIAVHGTVAQVPQVISGGAFKAKPGSSNNVPSTFQLREVVALSPHVRIDNLNTTVKGLASRIQVLEANMTTAMDNIRSFTSSSSAISSRLDTIESTVSGLQSTSSSCSSSLSSLQSSVNQQITNIQEQVNEIQTAVNNMQGSGGRTRGAKSCAEVKQCGETIADGEYWIYPDVFNGEKVKVHCYGMDGTPSEYITLPHLNEGVYPDVCNLNCRYEKSYGCPSAVNNNKGNFQYHKIKVNLQTMEVDRTDKEFAGGDGASVNYGSAADCYNTIWSNPTSLSSAQRCGPKGNFVMNSMGTGLKFKDDTQWTASGWRAGKYIIREDTYVEIYCGGWCGGCNPDKITLQHNSRERIPDGLATEIRCPA